MSNRLKKKVVQIRLTKLKQVAEAQKRPLANYISLILDEVAEKADINKIGSVL